MRVVFCSTRNTRTRIANQIRDLLVTAPDQLREVLEPLDTDNRVTRAAKFRCTGDSADPAEATKLALRTLARQHQTLSIDLDALRAQLDALTTQANPALRHAIGIAIRTSRHASPRSARYRTRRKQRTGGVPATGQPSAGGCWSLKAAPVGSFMPTRMP